MILAGLANSSASREVEALTRCRRDNSVTPPIRVPCAVAAACWPFPGRGEECERGPTCLETQRASKPAEAGSVVEPRKPHNCFVRLCMLFSTRLLEMPWDRDTRITRKLTLDKRIICVRRKVLNRSLPLRVRKKTAQKVCVATIILIAPIANLSFFSYYN